MSDELIEQPKIEFYEVSWKCTNCGVEWSGMLPKKILAEKDIAEKCQCPNCGRKNTLKVNFGEKIRGELKMSDELIELNETEFYGVDWICTNCGATSSIVSGYGHLKIPLGVTVEEFAKTHSCPNCKCYETMRAKL